MLAAGLAWAMPGASAHDPVTETYQERVAPFSESYTVQVQVGTEAYQVRVAPYTASHTYYTTETRRACSGIVCFTYDVSVPHTVTWQVYNYETRSRPVYETQTRTRAVYNYATRTRTVHDPHYEPPAQTGVTCGPPIQAGSPLSNALGCDPAPPPADQSQDDPQDPVLAVVGAVSDAVGDAIDWWEDDPLNGPAEEVFDNLNTAVDTAGEASETMSDIVCSGPGQAVAGESPVPGTSILIYAGCTATG